jgi:hypothetical protein
MASNDFSRPSSYLDLPLKRLDIVYDLIKHECLANHLKLQRNKIITLVHKDCLFRTKTMCAKIINYNSFFFVSHFEITIWEWYLVASWNEVLQKFHPLADPLSSHL